MTAPVGANYGRSLEVKKTVTITATVGEHAGVFSLGGTTIVTSPATKINILSVPKCPSSIFHSVNGVGNRDRHYLASSLESSFLNLTAGAGILERTGQRQRMKKLTTTVYVDGKPWDTMTEDERKDFHDKSVKRLEEALNTWFRPKHEHSGV